jgi:hypothetical protein
MTEPRPSIGLAEFNSVIAFVTELLNKPMALHRWCEARDIDVKALIDWCSEQADRGVPHAIASSIALVRGSGLEIVDWSSLGPGKPFLKEWDPEDREAAIVFVGLLLGFQVGVDLEKGRRDREQFGD